MPYIVSSSLDFSSKIIPSTRDQMNKLIEEKKKFVEEKKNLEDKQEEELVEDFIEEHTEEHTEEENYKNEIDESLVKKSTRGKNKKVGED